MGLLIAYYLAKSGVDKIAIVERGRLASEASYGNAGGIWTNLHFEYPRMKEFSELSMRLFVELVEYDGFEFEFRKNGALELLPINAKLDDINETIDELRRSGYDLSILSPDEVVSIEYKVSKNIGGGIYSPSDANANCSLLASQIVEKLKDIGVTIMDVTRVDQMSVEGNEIVSVNTSNGRIMPGTVVNAAGPWSPSIGSMVQLSVPIEPAKGYMLSTSPQEPLVKTAISNGDVVLTQRPNGIVRMGGTVEFVGFDKSLDVERMSVIMDEVIKMVPAVENMEIEEKWAGLRPYSKDRLPVIGFSTSIKNLIYATGHFRRGFELGPATGKIVTEMIDEGQPSLDISFMSPSRFEKI